MANRYGRYETIQPLATGGMATVFLGRAVGAGGFERRVAIKVMHEQIADDPDFVAMFLDEARLAAKIHHPNVVGTLDVQKGEEGMFLVMEYIEGASLKRVVRGMRKRRQRVPYGITARVICDTLAGLHAAHELKSKSGELMNLVHRDVSPHNILVGTDGVSRITDFGVARAEARLSTTRGGQLKGKIAYMPPEQGLGEDVDRRADVYAAGVCFWEMLVGRRLFKADHDGQLVAMVLRGAEQSPCDVIEDIPKPLNDVCMKALALEPDDRYATAADFADALEGALFEAGIRMASPRQVAAFVDDFKVEITHNSVPPIRSDDSVTGFDSMDTGRVSLASMPEPSNEESVDGQAASVASLVTTGVGPAVRRRNKLMLFGAIGAVAVVTAGLVLSLSGGSEAAPNTASSAQPAPKPTADETAAPAASSPAPAPAPAPTPTASETAPAPSASVAPSATTDPAAPTPPPTPYTVGPRPKPKPKPKSHNPLDHDPSTL